MSKVLVSIGAGGDKNDFRKMVIQRRRTSSGSLVGPITIAPLESTNQISSSEDSNDSWGKQVRNYAQD